jgi:hypothetical protein
MAFPTSPLVRGESIWMLKKFAPSKFSCVALPRYADGFECLTQYIQYLSAFARHVNEDILALVPSKNRESKVLGITNLEFVEFSSSE